jgi:hypothetical protein
MGLFSHLEQAAIRSHPPARISPSARDRRCIGYPTANSQPQWLWGRHDRSRSNPFKGYQSSHNEMYSFTLLTQKRTGELLGPAASSRSDEPMNVVPHIANLADLFQPRPTAATLIQWDLVRMLPPADTLDQLSPWGAS